jgi:glutamate dehydrogenase
VEALATALPKLLDGTDRAALDAAIARATAQGTPPELAARVVALDTLYAALDIVEEAGGAQRPVETVARIYFELATILGLAWLRERIEALPAEHHWQMLARGAMLDDLSGLQRSITRDVLGGGEALTAPRLVNAWQAGNRGAIERVGRLLAELRNGPAPDAAMLSVALRELRNLSTR